MNLKKNMKSSLSQIIVLNRFVGLHEVKINIKLSQN